MPCWLRSEYLYVIPMHSEMVWSTLTERPNKIVFQQNYLLSDGSHKRLFTPGPLGVSMTTKQAMLRDLGSRDEEFIRIVRDIRNTLVDIAGLSYIVTLCAVVFTMRCILWIW